MLSYNNYIHTDRGVMSIEDIYKLYEAELPLPNLMTCNTNILNANYLTFSFVPIHAITITNDLNMFECKFYDQFLCRTISLNCCNNTMIYRYNVISTDINAISNSNYGIINYIKANINNTRLSPEWILINNMVNYATKSPNICLGDTILRFLTKIYRNTEKGYSFIDSEGAVIPVFAGLTKSAHYNFILVK